MDDEPSEPEQTDSRDGVDDPPLPRPAVGSLGALVGLYVSWSWDLPTGGTIVLVPTIAFLAAWLFASGQGLLSRTGRSRTSKEPSLP